MTERFVVIDIVTGEYLAERFLRGFYLTSDISKAIQAKTEADAQEKIKKQSAY